MKRGAPSGESANNYGACDDHEQLFLCLASDADVMAVAAGIDPGQFAINHGPMPSVGLAFGRLPCQHISRSVRPSGSGMPSF
jgi:hypothetical protein